MSAQRRSQRDKKGRDLFKDKQILRYWVELLELKSGSKRNLPFRGIQKIHIPRKKTGVELPREELFELEDGSEKLEVKTFDELRERLREKYPDSEFERRLFYERDHEAEERWRIGMKGLIEIIAKAAVDDLLRKELGANPS